MNEAPTPIHVGQVWSVKDHYGPEKRRYVRVASTDLDVNDPDVPDGPKVEMVNTVTGQRSFPKGATVRSEFRLETDVETASW